MIVLAKFHLIPMSRWKVFLESAICNSKLEKWHLPGSLSQPFNW